MKTSEIVSYVKWFHFLILGRFSGKKIIKGPSTEFVIPISSLKVKFSSNLEKLDQKRKTESWSFRFFKIFFFGKNFAFFFKEKKEENFSGFAIDKKFRNKLKKGNFPGIQYVDFAGINSILPKIQELIEWPIRHWKIYHSLGLSLKRSILITGASGTGKTFLAHAIAGELRIPLICISVPSIVSASSGEIKKKLQKVLKKAERLSPSLIFIDNLDAISNGKENFPKETEKKISNQISDFLEKTTLIKKKVIVVASVIRSSLIDQSLKTHGRFEKEINLTCPDFLSRIEIIKHFISRIFIERTIKIKKLALKTQGFTSGDLSELIKTAFIFSISRIGAKFLKGKYRSKNFKTLGFSEVNELDFERSFRLISPKILKGDLVPSPNKSWKEVGGMENTRKILSKYIIQPIKKPFLGVEDGKKQFGILLFGPPGCGKTLIAQALAFESEVSFISIKGPEVLDKFLGESEKAIRSVFEKARTCSPSVIFFDEFDSIATKRSSSGTSSSQGATDRVVNQLLTEMDGTSRNHSIYLVAATNRPDMIDRALMRPGRIDKLVFIPLPSQREKISILKTISQKLTILPYLNFGLILEKFPTPLSGADLASCSKETTFLSREKKIVYYGIRNSGKGISVHNFLYLSFEDYSKGFSNVFKNFFFKSKISWKG